MGKLDKGMEGSIIRHGHFQSVSGNSINFKGPRMSDKSDAEIRDNCSASSHPAYGAFKTRETHQVAPEQPARSSG